MIYHCFYQYIIHKFLSAKQNDSTLNIFTTWCNIFNLSLIITKCKVMYFHRTRSMITFDYKLRWLLNVLSQVQDLSILFVHSLNFHLHIMTYSWHSYNFSLHSCLQALYNALVHLSLEYGTLVTIYWRNHSSDWSCVKPFYKFCWISSKNSSFKTWYWSINEVLKIVFFADRCDKFGINFIRGLIDTSVYAPRLLERLNICISSNTWF